MTTKMFSHTVRIPPLTDVEELMGCYKALLSTLGVEENIPFPSVEKFNHPIESENHKLVADYMTTMSQVSQATQFYGKLTLLNVQITTSSATFIFQYGE